MSTDRLEKLEALVASLHAALRSMSLYPTTHPAAARFFSKLNDTLTDLLSGTESVTVGVLEDALVLEGTPLRDVSELFQKLVQRLRAQQIGAVTFLNGTTPEEMRYLVELVGREHAGTLAESQSFLGARQVSHILLRPLKIQEEEVPVEPEKVQGRIIYTKALGVVKQIMQDARIGKIPSYQATRQTVEEILGGVIQDKNALIALTMIKSYDEYLFTHCVNVAILSLSLGEFLGLTKEALRELGLGAILHDVGKVYWPETLLKKPRGLNEEEWEIVRKHPIDGVKLLENMGGTHPQAAGAILEHHTRYDRTGYPSLQEKKEPNFFSMIVTIADTYDALTTVRPYQNAREPATAIARMRELSGTVLDPQLTESFVRMVGIYPIGTVVRLSTGELAVVVKPGTEDTTRPIVTLLTDPMGQRTPEGAEVDLMEKDPASGQFLRTIVLAVDPALKNLDTAPYLSGQPTAS